MLLERLISHPAALPVQEAELVLENLGVGERLGLVLLRMSKLDRSSFKVESGFISKVLYKSEALIRRQKLLRSQPHPGSVHLDANQC